MPSFDVVKETDAQNSFRVASVMGQFDLQSSHIRERFVGTLDIEDKSWNIGVIYGASGTGKTSIVKELFRKHYIRDLQYQAASILDDMPTSQDVKTITKTFNAVGFSSPPSWLKPYSVLSTGEQMRVNLARAILEERDLIVFDEFTSVVNRDVAKIGSYAIQKTIRRLKKQFIAVTCHYDVLEWLQPDWTFCTDDMRFFFGQNMSDRTLSCKSENSAGFGICLGNIII